MDERPKRLPVAEQLRKGLEEAIRHAKGEITLKTTVVELADPPPEVPAAEVVQLRLDNKMSQYEFARLLNVSTKTVESWEQGSRRPSTTAQRLLQVLRQSPAVVLQAAGLTLQGTDAQPATGTNKSPSSKGKAKKQAV